MHILKCSGTFILRKGNFLSWTTIKVSSYEVSNAENTAKPDMPRDQDFVQPMHLHRNCDQREWWKLFLKGDKDSGWVQCLFSVFAEKTPFTFETFKKALASSSGICRAWQQPGWWSGSEGTTNGSD